MSDHKKPWWNDGDKVAGAAATIVILSIAVLAAAGVVKAITWMF